MHKLTGVQLPVFPVENLRRVADLEYFEGPLVTHFRSTNDESYIFYWVDSDDNFNRWMVLRISERNLIKVSNKVITIDKVVPVESQDSFVYFIDIDSDGKHKVVQQVKKSEIPAEYIPMEGARLYYRNPEIEHYFPIFAEKPDLSWEELNEIPRTFTQAYSAIALLTTNVPPHIQSYPWRGGFSAVGFYGQIEKRLPEGQKWKLDGVQYTSPGYFNFHLDRSTAEFVSKCALIVGDPKSEVRKAHTALYNYIREHGLNKLSKSSAKWKEHDDVLKLQTVRMLKGLGIQNISAIFNAVDRPFEAAKITGSIVKRLRKLARFRKDGIVDFPTSE